MNKTAIVLVIIILLIIGGLAYYMHPNTESTPATPNNINTTGSNTTTNTGSGTQTTTPSAPLVMTNASVAPSNTTAVVTGSVTPNGASTRYWFEYSPSSDFSGKLSTPVQTIGSGYVLISAPGYITGLIKDTKYFFRLVAENQYGTVNGEQYSFQTSLNNPLPLGSVPTVKTVAANSISTSTATLKGEVTPNKVLTQFWFEYGKTNDFGNVSSFISVGDGAALSGASLPLSGLDANTKYYFRINAQNQFGTVNGSTLSFKTLSH